MSDKTENILCNERNLIFNRHYSQWKAAEMKIVFNIAHKSGKRNLLHSGG
jgi:hypothetical protein